MYLREQVIQVVVTPVDQSEAQEILNKLNGTGNNGTNHDHVEVDPNLSNAERRKKVTEELERIFWNTNSNTIKLHLGKVLLGEYASNPRTPEEEVKDKIEDVLAQLDATQT